MNNKDYFHTQTLTFTLQSDILTVKILHKRRCSSKKWGDVRGKHHYMLNTELEAGRIELQRKYSTKIGSV